MTATLRPADAPAVPDPLQPVREALLAHAERDAAALRAAADRDAAAAVTTARQQARARRDAARDEGEREAEAVRVHQRARARRAARALVLAAQREALEQVRAQVRADVRAWWEDPRLRPLLVDRLSSVARAELGPEAVVREHPAGGVVAEAPGRRARYLLTDLADASLDELGPRLLRVWQP